MALNGQRTREDKRSRLLKTEKGFVTAVRTGPQVYEVYKDGELLGDVRKFRSWFACTNPPRNALGCTGDDAYKTRRDALEALVHAQVN